MKFDIRCVLTIEADNGQEAFNKLMDFVTESTTATKSSDAGGKRHFVRQIHDGAETRLTAHEQAQFAYGWLCLQMLRALVADGEAEGAVALLRDPKALAAAFRAQFRVQFREDG